MFQLTIKYVAKYKTARVIHISDLRGFILKREGNLLQGKWWYNATNKNYEKLRRNLQTFLCHDLKLIYWRSQCRDNRSSECDVPMSSFSIHMVLRINTDLLYGLFCVKDHLVWSNSIQETVILDVFFIVEPPLKGNQTFQRFMVIKEGDCQKEENILWILTGLFIDFWLYEELTAFGFEESRH